MNLFYFFMIGLVMNDLEKAIVNSMLGFGDTFRANFGAFTRVEDKVGNQDPNDVVTSTDRESQEAILQAIFLQLSEESQSEPDYLQSI